MGTDKCQLNCETVHVVWSLKLELTLTLPEEASWMISKLESGTEEEANLKKRKNVLILEIFLVPTKSGSPWKKSSVCLPSRFQVRAAATPASWATVG